MMSESVNLYEPHVKEINGPALLLDFVLLYGFGLIGGVLIPKITGIHIRGFFCDDESIRYDYKEDTVTPVALFLYVFFVMILTVVATEIYRSKRISQESLPQFKLGDTTVHTTVIQIVIYLAYSQIGFISIYVLTNVTKSCIGRLRPHFLDVCKPTNITCTHSEYYASYTCTGNADLVAEARKSFFSGHSAFSMYASTFTALYLLARMPHNALRGTALPVLQTALISIGLLISYSRINDNKHHWSDVIVGIFVGVFVATYTCLVWAGMFTKQSEEVLPIRRAHAEYSDVTAATSEGSGNENVHPDEK